MSLRNVTGICSTGRTSTGPVLPGTRGSVIPPVAQLEHKAPVRLPFTHPGVLREFQRGKQRRSNHHP